MINLADGVIVDVSAPNPASVNEVVNIIGLPGPVGPTGPQGIPGTSTASAAVVDITDFGAIGNADWDCTSAINAACAALPASGGEVYFPSGSFVISAPVTIKHGVTFRGDGSLSSTIMQTTLNANGIVTETGTGVIGNPILRVRIQGLGLVGFGAALTAGSGNAIVLGNLTNVPTSCALRDVFIDGFGGWGVVANTAIATTLDTVSVASCGHGSAAGGIFINGVGGQTPTSLVLKNCYANSNFGPGFKIVDTFYSVLDGCASDTNHEGYNLSLCSNVSLISCGTETMRAVGSNGGGHGTGDGFLIDNCKSVSLVSCISVQNPHIAFNVKGSSQGISLVSCREHSVTGTPTASFSVESGSTAAVISPVYLTATSFAAGTTTIVGGTASPTYVSNEAINIMNAPYNAVGNNSTNDAPAIQAAIDAAFAAGGGTVHIPPKTFAISATLTMKSGVTLKGFGKKSSVIRMTNANLNAISAQDIWRPAFEDIGICGPGGVSADAASGSMGTGTGSGILLVVPHSPDVTGHNAVFYPVLRDVLVEGFGVDGISMEVPVAGTLDGVTSFHNGRHGVNFWTTSGSEITGTSMAVKNCYFAGNGGLGFNVDHMAYSTLTACASDSNGGGYSFTNCSAVTMIGSGSESSVNVSARGGEYVSWTGFTVRTLGSKVTIIDGFSVDGPNGSNSFEFLDGSVVTAIGLRDGASSHTPAHAVYAAVGSTVALFNPSLTSSTFFENGANATVYGAKPTQVNHSTSYTLLFSDAENIVELESGSAMTATVPPNSSVAYPIGTRIRLRQYGTGQVTVTPSSSAVTIRSRGTAMKLNGQYAEALLTKRGTDEWVLSGDTTT